MKISIIDDDSFFRNAFVSYYEASTKNKCIIASDSYDNVNDNSMNLGELLITEVQLDGKSTINNIREVKESNSNLNIVVLSSNCSHEFVLSAIKAGANGYILKHNPFSIILKKIEEIRIGKHSLSSLALNELIEGFQIKSQTSSYQLTERELEVIRGLTDGLTYKELSESLYISLSTVQTHIKHIYKKLNVNSKTEVVKKSLQGEFY